MKCANISRCGSSTQLKASTLSNPLPNFTEQLHDSNEVNTWKSDAEEDLDLLLIEPHLATVAGQQQPIDVADAQ